MEKTVKKGRNSSIELLRIVCLVMIFWMHAADSGVANGIGAWIDIAVAVIGNIGVSCFILISGYYGIRLDVKKMMHLECMLLFYSWMGLLFQYVWGNALGGEEILSYLLPVIGKRSWYFTCYFALAFLSPFLNEMVEKLSEAHFRQLLITMLVIFSGVTTFFFFDINSDGGKGITQMVMLYLIGRYIGVYRVDRQYNTAKLAGWFALLAGVNFCLNGALYVVTGTVQNRFARDNTLFTIFEAILVFLIFRNHHFENAFVNRLAKHVPAVFLFEWTLRGFISHYMFDYVARSGENTYEFLLLGIALLLVVMGSVIDWARVTLFHVPEAWCVEHIYRLGDRCVHKIKSKKIAK